MGRMIGLGSALASMLVTNGTLAAQSNAGPLLGRVTLHAHNCYPEEGLWTDGLDRALGTQVQPIAIEQDLVWFVDPATGQGRSVLSHGGVPTGCRRAGLERRLQLRVARRGGPSLAGEPSTRASI